MFLVWVFAQAWHLRCHTVAIVEFGFLRIFVVESVLRDGGIALGAGIGGMSGLMISGSCSYCKCINQKKEMLWNEAGSDFSHSPTL